MNLGKPVTPGQKIAIPAGPHERPERMAQTISPAWSAARALERPASIRSRSSSRNDSGGTVSRFGVLGIGDVIFTPDDHLGKFQNGYAFKGSRRRSRITRGNSSSCSTRSRTA